MAENVKRKKKKRAVLIVLMALVLAVLATVIKEFLHTPVRVKPAMRLKNSVYRERK